MKIKKYIDFDKKLNDLFKIKKIQSKSGDDSYNVGLYNGIELATSILNDEDPKYKKIKEDKIIKFSEYQPSKYNGNIVVDQIMEWLRAKLVDNPDSDTVAVPLSVFFKECSVDKNKFMTFYNEMNKTQIVKNFKVNIKGDYIIFTDFKNNEEKENVNVKI